MGVCMRVGISLTRDHTDPILSLKYDAFVWLVNNAINKPSTPEKSSAQLSEDLQNDIEFNGRGQELSTWTCTPSARVTSGEIPLCIDGHPVVIPVDYKYNVLSHPKSAPFPHFASCSAVGRGHPSYFLHISHISLRRTTTQRNTSSSLLIS